MSSKGTAYIDRTPSSGGNRKTWTWSCWLKRTGVNSAQRLFSAGSSIGTNNDNLLSVLFESDNTLKIFSEVSASTVIDLRTTRVFTDTFGYYHIVIAFDTTQATAADRVKIYVNGTQETALSATTYPSLNLDTFVNHTVKHRIGYTGSSFDGIMSHMHFADGTAYAASTFGETDSTTGEWKLTLSPSFTLGTNGFTIFKNDNTITDQSTNSNDWTQANGSISATQDCPSNVFCTMNDTEFDFANADSDIGAGGTFVYPRANGNYTYAMSTLAMPKGNGKFYFEAKRIVYDTVEAAVGIVDAEFSSEIFYENRPIVTATNTTAIGRVLANSDGHSIISGTANSSYGLGSLADGDIVCMACDMENGAFYFRKNDGSWANSGDPTSGASKTGAIDISATSQWTSSSHWRVWCGDGATNHDRWAFNFGNGNFPSQSGSFGSQSYSTTAVSSAGTNASGIGIFEFDVPTGYTALCTKGLNE